MPVAVHGIEQKAVRNLAPAACAALPGEGAGRHRGRLRAAARIHHGLLLPYIATLREAAAAAKCERSRSASRAGAPGLAELEGGREFSQKQERGGGG